MKAIWASCRTGCVCRDPCWTTPGAKWESQEVAEPARGQRLWDKGGTDECCSCSRCPQASADGGQIMRWALAEGLFFPKPSAVAAQAAELLIYLPKRLLTCCGLLLVARLGVCQPV